MDLFQVDNAGQLFISPAIEDWAAVARLRDRRPGALFNDGFAPCLASLDPSAPLST